MILKESIKKALDNLVEEAYIDQIIDDFIQGDGADFLAMTIKESLDIDRMAEVVMSLVMQRALTFRRDSYAGVVCNACGKPFGDFVADSGAKIAPSQILHEGQKIILLD